MDYPKVNGHRHSFASLELNIDGKRRPLFNAVNYSDSVSRERVRGNHPIAAGFTRGEYEAEASITFYSEEWGELAEEFGNGLYDKVFDVVVTYSEDDGPTITDKLIGCRLRSIGRDNSQGAEGASVEKELDVTYIEWNGRKPFARMPQGDSSSGGTRSV